jgi:hypothetical protein
MVSTAKEGLFKPQSTMVFEMPKGQLEPRRAVAKIIYTQSLLASDRLQMHDAICKMLDESGETMPLGEAVDTCSSFLKRRGVVIEVVNLALSPFTDLL